MSLKLQWYAGTKPIARATGTTLKVSTALKGKALSVKVTASAPGYTGLVVRTKSTPKIT